MLCGVSVQAPTGNRGKQYQTAFCPKTAELEVAPSHKYWFEGTIGQKHVRMYLERGGGAVVGVFYDTTDWSPLTLGGRWIDGEEGAVELIARNEWDFEGGSLKGEISAQGLSGVWSPSKDESQVTFHLKEVEQPKCDGKGTWRVFEDGHWPIRFSYPASWHVSVSGDSVSLICPDPSLMAYDGYEIDITQGPTANNATTDFVQCGDKWIYGYACQCGEAKRCKSAPVSEQSGITILNGDDRDWPVYCRGGGALGAGHGRREILTFEDAWIVVEGQGPPADLVERIVGTAKKRR
jgi:hypothetical protein